MTAPLQKNWSAESGGSCNVKATIALLPGAIAQVENQRHRHRNGQERGDMLRNN
jgi:hypothetical protein